MNTQLTSLDSLMVKVVFILQEDRKRKRSIKVRDIEHPIACASVWKYR